MSGVSVSLPVVLFTVDDGMLKVFQTEKRLPSWSLYAGVALDEAAKILFSQAVGQAADDCFFEQLYTFSPPATAERTLAICYYFLVPSHLLSTRSGPAWVEIRTILPDHPDYDVIQYAVQRLRWKIEYTNVVYSLLPQEFTLGELQRTYEAILGERLDKRNFRKKMLSLKLLKESGRKRLGLPGRGAMLYTFRSHQPGYVKVF